ncbi:MAG TPA: hypothetical protein VFF06_01000 [Polyangia bacterium]|nr:hypothetical protein [Polyangia bacterium]
MLTREEGSLTRAVEKQTARIPSMVFLGLAGASIAGALAAFLAGRRQLAAFIGEWAPTVLLLGVYNKLVKEAT